MILIENACRWATAVLSPSRLGEARWRCEPVGGSAAWHIPQVVRPKCRRRWSPCAWSLQPAHQCAGPQLSHPYACLLHSRLLLLLCHAAPIALQWWRMVKANDLCILITLNQAVEIYFHTLSHPCPHSHPSLLLARQGRVAIAADDFHCPTSQEDRQQQWKRWVVGRNLWPVCALVSWEQQLGRLW